MALKEWELTWQTQFTNGWGYPFHDNGPCRYDNVKHTNKKVAYTDETLPWVRVAKRTSIWKVQIRAITSCNHITKNKKRRGNPWNTVYSIMDKPVFVTKNEALAELRGEVPSAITQ